MLPEIGEIYYIDRGEASLIGKYVEPEIIRDVQCYVFVLYETDPAVYLIDPCWFSVRIDENIRKPTPEELARSGEINGAYWAF